MDYKKQLEEIERLKKGKKELYNMLTPEQKKILDASINKISKVKDESDRRAIAQREIEKIKNSDAYKDNATKH